jgi:hypothetical protein
MLRLCVCSDGFFSVVNHERAYRELRDVYKAVVLGTEVDERAVRLHGSLHKTPPHVTSR